MAVSALATQRNNLHFDTFVPFYIKKIHHFVLKRIESAQNLRGKLCENLQNDCVANFGILTI